MSDESAEKTRKLHLANEAKRLLAEPLIDNFFNYQEALCFEAFRRLPMGSTVDEYRTVHHDLLAVDRLKSALQTYIQEADIIAMQDRRGEAPEI